MGIFLADLTTEFGGWEKIIIFPRVGGKINKMYKMYIYIYTFYGKRFLNQYGSVSTVVFVTVQTQGNYDQFPVSVPKRSH